MASHHGTRGIRKQEGARTKELKRIETGSNEGIVIMVGLCTEKGNQGVRKKRKQKLNQKGEAHDFRLDRDTLAPIRVGVGWDGWRVRSREMK